MADPILGLDLWRGAKVGMRPRAVQALFPAARPPVRIAMLTGGEVDLLQLVGVDIAGQPAVAHFYFKDDRLVSVELTPVGLRHGGTAANVDLAKQIAGVFSSRYGRPYDCGDKSLAQVAIYECKWLQKPLSIRLWYMDAAGQAPLFYVAYRQADDPGYNL